MAKVKYVGGKGVMWSLSSICSLGKKKKKCNGDVYEWNDSVTPWVAHCNENLYWVWAHEMTLDPV